MESHDSSVLAVKQCNIHFSSFPDGFEMGKTKLYLMKFSWDIIYCIAFLSKAKAIGFMTCLKIRCSQPEGEIISTNIFRIWVKLFLEMSCVSSSLSALLRILFTFKMFSGVTLVCLEPSCHVSSESAVCAQWQRSLLVVLLWACVWGPALGLGPCGFCWSAS